MNDKQALDEFFSELFTEEEMEILRLADQNIDSDDLNNILINKIANDEVIK